MSSKEIQLKVLDITLPYCPIITFPESSCSSLWCMGDLSSNTYFAISTNTDSHSFFFYYYFYVVTVVLYHSLSWAEEPGPQSMVEPLVEPLCGRLMDRSRGYRQKDLVEVPLCASPRAWILFLSLLPVFPILPKVAGCGCRVLPAALLVLITTPSRACV